MPRSASPAAVRTMNGLICPAPAPCATTIAAVGEPVRYTFKIMRTAPVSALILALFAATASAQRLPAGVVPVHYDIAVAPDLAAAKFTGQETIRVTVDKPTSVVVLNAAEI